MPKRCAALQKDDQTILVAGTLAADTGAQCGGGRSLAGATGNITPGTNILAGIENAVGDSEVIYSPMAVTAVPVDVVLSWSAKVLMPKERATGRP
ncbi:MAG: hypothetical protein H6558_00235 [Lewinellaceae bacterium]|nr:hypothetical protein [Lewinellaceae bacterium]